MGDVTHLIGGRDVPGVGPEMEKRNPATGVVAGTFRAADPVQVREAVDAARAAFRGGEWARAPFAQRQETLRRAGAAIRHSAGDLADVQVSETGLLRTSALRQIEGAAAWFDYYADYLATEGGEVFGKLAAATTIVLREPVGVAALFAPWNVPIGLAAIKLAPCLAAGNSAVLKPSEETPETARLLVDLIAGAGLPRGVLNCVNGPGPSTGAALAEAQVDVIAFTGGHAGGAAVARAAAARALPVTLELGGKSANIVFADADFDAALEGALTAIFANNGQACLAGARILVEAPIAERFMAAFADRARAIRVGDPTDPETEIGPMISDSHRGRVTSFFDSAARDGDIAVCGGTIPDRPGYYVAPSAFRVASPKSRLWREEVFGPVAAFAIFGDESEAVRLANDTEHGLVAYVWTRDVGRAMRVAGTVRAGTILVNTVIQRELNAPFGGYGLSGVGREGGRFSWANFTEAKTVVLSHA